jgi:hypothetical protein
MAIEHAGVTRWREQTALLGLSALLLLGFVLMGLQAGDPMLRYGSFFVSGILAGGAWMRLRQMRRAAASGCRIDAERIEWTRAGTHHALEWGRVARVILVDRPLPGISLMADDGQESRIPALCLPEDPAAILRELLQEVSPAHPHLRIYHNEKRLRPLDERAPRDRRS